MPVILQVLAIVRGLFDLIKFGKEVIQDDDDCKNKKKDKDKSNEKPDS